MMCEADLLEPSTETVAESEIAAAVSGIRFDHASADALQVARGTR